MTVHFDPTVEELLDCKYEWCGRIGTYGFRREDHRMEHYRSVHTKESEYPKTRKDGRSARSGVRKLGHLSNPTASMTHVSVDAENHNRPVRTKTFGSDSKARKEELSLSGNTQASGQSTEAGARFGDPEVPEFHGNPPDPDTAVLNVFDWNSLMPEHLDAENPESMDRKVTKSRHIKLEKTGSNEGNHLDWMGTTSGVVKSEETESKEAKDLGVSSDDENEPERLQDGILDDPRTRAECGHLQQTDKVLDRGEIPMKSKSRHSTNYMLAVMEPWVLKALSASETGQYRASLEIQWDILGFMQNEFRDKDFPNTVLGHVVTISGSAKHAQATSCSEYIRQNWPTHGSKVLDALQCALDSPTHTSQWEFVAGVDDENVSSDGAASSHTHLEFDVTPENVVLKITSGTQDTIVDVVQQLAWMGAALRTSKDGRVQCCESKLQGVEKVRGVEPAIFNLTFDIYSPGEDDQSCWFSLFTNPVIA